MRRFLVLAKDGYFEPNGRRARYLFDERKSLIIYRKNRLKTYLKFVYILLSARSYVYLVGFEIICLSILFILGYKNFILDTGDNECALSKSYRNKILTMIICTIERWAIKNARFIISRTETYKKILEDKRKGVFLIRDCIDVDMLKKYKNIPETFTIGIIGNLNIDKRTGKINGSELIEIVNMLNKDGYNVRGFILGKGKAFSYLKKMAEGKNVEVMEKWVPIEKIGHLIENITVGLNIQTDDEIGNVRLGAKVLNYLATSRFIISTATGDCKKILPEYFLIKNNSEFIKESVKRIKEILNKPEVLEKRFIGENIAKMYFDLSKIRKELNKILERLSFK